MRNLKTILDDLYDLMTSTTCSDEKREFVNERASHRRKDAYARA